MSIKTSLGRKAGPLPRWAWLGIALLAVGAWWLKHRRDRGTAPAVTDSLAQQRVSIVPMGSATAEDQWAAHGGGLSQNAAPANSLSPDVLTALGDSQTHLAELLGDIMASQFTDGAGTYAGSTGQGTIAPEAATVAVTAPAATSGALPITTVAAKPKPFGGIIDVRKLKNGSTLTTYASGRKVQQAPGKSPYVVKG